MIIMMIGVRGLKEVVVNMEAETINDIMIVEDKTVKNRMTGEIEDKDTTVETKTETGMIETKKGIGVTIKKVEVKFATTEKIIIEIVEMIGNTGEMIAEVDTTKTELISKEEHKTEILGMIVILRKGKMLEVAEEVTTDKMRLRKEEVMKI